MTEEMERALRTLSTEERAELLGRTFRHSMAYYEDLAAHLRNVSADSVQKFMEDSFWRSYRAMKIESGEARRRSDAATRVPRDGEIEPR